MATIFFAAGSIFQVKLWSSQLWTQFLQLRREAWKFQDFNGVWTTLTNWAMKPLTLGAGHLWVLMVPWGINQWWNGIWNEPYMNCGYEIKWSYDLRSYERNFCNCVEKPEKFRTSTGFEPVTSRFRCDALTNWAMKPIANCKNCVHNCEDHSFTWFHIRSSYMIHFIYHFIRRWFIPHGNIRTHSSQCQWLHSSVG